MFVVVGSVYLCFYVKFMYIENKGLVVGLLHKFNALVLN